MSKLLKNQAFKYGMFSGVVSSLAVQLFTYIDLLIIKERLSHLSGISICIISSWGFPFPIFYGGDFILFGFIGNVLVTMIFSLILGLIFKFAWSKIVSQKLQ